MPTSTLTYQATMCAKTREPLHGFSTLALCSYWSPAKQSTRTRTRTIKHFNPTHPLQSPQLHLKMSEGLSEHTRNLPPLKVGDHVRIQNQTSNHLNKWNRTGRVVKVKQYRQYPKRVDGSGRTKMRNGKFLRKLTPVNLDQNPYSTHHPTYSLLQNYALTRS